MATGTLLIDRSAGPGHQRPLIRVIGERGALWIFHVVSHTVSCTGCGFCGLRGHWPTLIRHAGGWGGVSNQRSARVRAVRQDTHSSSPAVPRSNHT